MMTNRTITNQCGFGLIEVVVVTAIVTIALSGFLEAGSLAVRLLGREKETLTASFLAKEGLEAARSLRDESWTNISNATIGTAYYPTIENGKWRLAATNPGVIQNKFTRSIVFDRVYRNGADQITTSGTEDANSRKATVTIVWGSSIYQLATYFTNFQSYLSLPTESKSIFFEDAPIDTNFADFPSPNTGSGDPAQSFTTIGSIQATKLELLLRRATTSPSNIYMELRASPTGTIMGSSTILNGSTISSSSPTWVTFRFEKPVTLAASTKYYIRLRSNPSSTDLGSSSVGPIQWSYRQTAGSPYAGGDAYTSIGQLSNPADQGTQQVNYDFGFRVWSL